MEALIGTIIPLLVIIAGALWQIDRRCSERTKTVHDKIDHIDQCLDELKVESARAHADMNARLANIERFWTKPKQ